MRQLRVLLVDDEPLVREGLRDCLADATDVSIVGECGDGEAAIAAIESLGPDIVFLDIRMPGKDGFEVVRDVSAPSPFLVVFVTAHDDRALEAFEASAVDYLLKPFDCGRVERALARARAILAGQDGEQLEARLSGLVRRMAQSAPEPPRIAVQKGNRTVLLEVSEVEYISAAGNYARLVSDGAEYLARATMQEIADRLAPYGFVRIHRSVVVDASRVRELHTTGTGRTEVMLRSGKRLPASDAGLRRLQALLDPG